MSFWNRVLGFLVGDTTPGPPLEIEPMASDLSNIPQNITDDLADLQQKFNDHQSANTAVVSKQAALATAQADLNVAVTAQQQTGQAVHDALTKLTTDIATDYADPTDVELVPATSAAKTS